MTRLLRVELVRLSCRRGVRVLVGVALLLSVLAAVQVVYSTRAPSAGEIRTAEAQAAIAARSPSVRGELAECESDPSSYLGPGATQAGCAAAILPTTQGQLTREPLRLGRVLDGPAVQLTLLLAGLLVVAAATYAGSDWASRSIRTQALVEPRRRRLWTAKALAVAIGALVTGAVTLLVFWVPVWVTAAERGVPVAAATPGLITWHLLRALVLLVVTSVAAYALTMFFRRTVATVGLVFGIGVAAELLLGLLPVRGTGRLSPGHNVTAWLLGQVQYGDSTLRCPTGTDTCSQQAVLGMWPAGLLIAGVAVVAVAVSVTNFARRSLP